MIEIRRTDSSDQDFQALVTMLDDELRIRDGADHPFYAQFNKLDAIRHVLVAYDDHVAVGCGAFRQYSENTVEIKRMFVHPVHRGQGIASLILSNLESWAFEEGYTECILETGYNQPEAIALYKKAGYLQITNYGPYADVANSICFGKKISGLNPPGVAFQPINRP